MDAGSSSGPRTLFVSRDPMLLLARIAMLRHAGLPVFPGDLADAPVLLRAVQFDALILCNSLNADEKREVIAQFKSRSPGGRVVAVISTASDSVEAEIQIGAPVTQKQWRAVCRALKTGCALTL